MNAMKAMKAQKITLIILGAITLILLMIVLSVVGSLSSIAEQRDTNNAKITAIEQEKAIVQSVWDSLQDEYMMRILMEAKIDAGLRDRWPVVADGDRVVWVCGYRIDEAYKITETTRRVAEVTLPAETVRWIEQHKG